jgi:hypothetical protein
MTDGDIAKLLERLVRIEIAIQSVNPDPAQTIQSYRDMRAAQQRAADGLVTATAALVGATKRLAWATWALVVLTAVVAASTVLELIAAVR